MCENKTVTSYLCGKSEGFARCTDVVLEVKGTHFPVHSHVLANSCQFFDDLLYDLPGKGPVELAEAGRKRIIHATFPDDVVEAFPLFLAHVYSGLGSLKLQADEAERLVPVLDYFGAESSLKDCSTCLANPVRVAALVKQNDGNLNRDQLLKEISRASRHKLRELMAECLPYLVESFRTATNANLAMPATPGVTAASLPFSVVPKNLDSTVSHVLLEALLASQTSMYTHYKGTTAECAIPLQTVGSGAAAVSRQYYEEALSRQDWGH